MHHILVVSLRGMAADVPSLYNFHATPTQGEPPPPTESEGRRLANEMLMHLAEVLETPPLTLDHNNTCVIDFGARCAILLTYDLATERLFSYSTLLTTLPTDPVAKLALYEFLLEGALLGRDMAGALSWSHA